MSSSSEKANAIMQGHASTKKLLAYVLPTIITVVFASIYGIVDGLFVSNVGGTTAFAAVNLITPLFLIIASFGMMFGTGGNAIISKLRGEGKNEEANKAFSTLTVAVIAVGIFLTIILEIFLGGIIKLLGADAQMTPYCETYARILIPFVVFYLLQFYFQSILVTAGKGMLGFIMTLAAGFANIIGDAIFVGILAKTPEQAIMGASWSTVIGLFIGGAIPLIYFLKKNSSFFRLRKPEMNLKLVAKTCSNGVSEFLTNISGAITTTVFNAILIGLAGQIGVAAYGGISYINTIFCAVFMGYSVGIAPVIAYKYGANDIVELKSVVKRSLIIIGIASLAMVLIGEVFAYPLSALFAGSDKQVLEMTMAGFTIFAISFLFKGFNTFGSALFTALNNGLISGILALFRALIFSIGMALLLPNLFAVIFGQSSAILGVWWSVVVAELLAFVMTVIFVKLKNKKYQYL